MGYYVNHTSKGTISNNIRKHLNLVQDGAVIIDQPLEWCENLVCIVDNGMFEAVAYCKDQRDFDDFTDVDDYRRKTWLIWDKVKDYAR